MEHVERETIGAPPSSEAPSIPLGSILAGKYRIDEKLGEGGMGVVYGGTHLELKTRVAIKFLLHDTTADPRAKARFLREARLAASIEGEHSTRIHDVTTDERGRPFMVMEYLAGESADARLFREKRLPLEVAVTIVLQLLDALAEAHARGLVHRDVKPANLFLTQRPGEALWVKVLDFGISKLTEEKTEEQGGITLTAPRTLLGSPEYMSPEQLRDSANVDLRSDLWACGVTLFELLTGRTPFRGDSLADLCAIVISQPPPPLAEAGAPDVPPEIERLIRKCLEKEPQERPKNAYELAVALAPFGNERARSLLPRIRAWCKEVGEPSPDRTAPPPRRRVFVGGIALVAVAGIAAFVAASMRYAGTRSIASAGAELEASTLVVSSQTTAPVASPLAPTASTATNALPASAPSPNAPASAPAPVKPASSAKTNPHPKPIHDLDGIDLMK